MSFHLEKQPFKCLGSHEDGNSYEIVSTYKSSKIEIQKTGFVPTMLSGCEISYPTLRDLAKVKWILGSNEDEYGQHFIHFRIFDDTWRRGYFRSSYQ